MAYNEPLRRVSMGYILGFSKDPFKNPSSPQGPPPAFRGPKRGRLREMLTTPGGPIEWAASDGRKGALNPKHRPSLTAANLGMVPVQQGIAVPDPPKPASKKLPSEPGVLGDFGGLFGGEDVGVKAAADHAPEENKDAGNPFGFSKEQDDRIMEMKTADAGASWADIAGRVGMTQSQCKDRFKQIKPSDWRPANAGKDKSGSGGKKEKGKNQPQKQGQGQGQGKKEDKKEDVPSWETTDKNYTGGGAVGWDKPAAGGGGVDTTWNAGNTNDADGAPFNWNNPGNDSGNAWGNVNNNINCPVWESGLANNPYQIFQANTINPDNAAAPNFGSWDAPAGNPAPVSHKGSSVKSSRRVNGPDGMSVVYVEPDDTFSAEELKLLARILRKDYQGLWQRVASRFRDKAGRTLHPDVIQQKLTGEADDKSSA